MECVECSYGCSGIITCGINGVIGGEYFVDEAS